MNTWKEKCMKAGFYSILGCFLLPTVLLFWFLIKGAVQSSDELVRLIGPAISDQEGYAVWTWLPEQFSFLPEFAALTETEAFVGALGNSLMIVIPAVAGQFLIAAPTAWALSRLRFPGRKMLIGFYICLMLLPFQVTMLPNYLVISRLQLMDTLWAVILPVAFSAFPVYIMMKGFDSVSMEIIEAAQIDGAGWFRIFLHIGLPVGRPGIAAALLLGFLECWNLVEQPMLFLRSSVWWPLSLYLPKLMEEGPGVMILASVITIIPALAAFLAGQKYLVLGIQYAGIKG